MSKALRIPDASIDLIRSAIQASFTSRPRRDWEMKDPHRTTPRVALRTVPPSRIVEHSSSRPCRRSPPPRARYDRVDFMLRYFLVLAVTCGSLLVASFVLGL